MLSKDWRITQTEGVEAPSVCVIIPAYNEEAIIGECLTSLALQTYENFKAFIIDDASTDTTREKILEFSRRFPNKIHLKEYGKVGPGRARNLAARDSTSEILAFMDADCVASPDWIAELVKGFETQTVGSTGGPHFAPTNSTPFQQRVESFFRFVAPSIGFYKSSRQIHESEISETVHNPLCNVAYKREVFAQAGGFREDLFPGEDVEIDFKVRANGHRITFNPKAFVYHYRPENIRQFRKVMHAYGRAQGKLVREYGLKRAIQVIGVGVFSFLFAAIIVATLVRGALGFVVSLGLVAIVFQLRPPLSSRLGIWLNCLEWLNGFAEGYLTNRSDPPGKKMPQVVDASAVKVQ